MIILYSPFEVAPVLQPGMLRISQMAELRYLVESKDKPAYVVDRYGNTVENGEITGFRNAMADILPDNFQHDFNLVISSGRPH